MKIKYLLCFLGFILGIFLMSCSNGVNNPTRYYYNGYKGSSSSQTNKPADIDDNNIIPADKDPFKKGEWNNQNYRFDGSLIKNYFFAASFDGKNVPSYRFFLDYKRAWEIEDYDYNAYKYDGSGDGNKAQGYNINPANFYKYEGINPLVSYNSSYNKSDRMKRFIFYRLQGKAVVVPLNNYLIAVDAYSKFVFAYGKITKTANALGQAYPTEFQPVESHGEKRKFYEYDPIGIMIYDNVSAELKLKLYEEYQNEMAKDANAFFPQIHDINRGLASENKAGLSPYFVLSDNSNETHITNNIIITAKSLKNISVKSAAGYLYWGKPKFDDIKDFGYFTYGIGASSYDDFVPSSVEWLENLYPDGVGASTVTLDYDKLKININNEKSFTSSKSYEFENINQKEVYIELASSVFKYNTLKAAIFGTYVDTDNFGKSGSGKMAIKDSPKVKLKYDSSKETFIIDENSINENKDISTTITYDKNFTLKKGENKDFTIKYNWKKGNDTTNGEEFEIIYNLEFK